MSGEPAPHVSGSVAIREATAEDGAALLRLAADFATSFPVEEARFHVALAEILRDPTASLLVAESGGSVVGYLLGFEHLTFYANGRVAWVEEIMVREACRRSGVGVALMRNFERWATERDCKLVALATRRAAPFYRALGYGNRQSISGSCSKRGALIALKERRMIRVDEGLVLRPLGLDDLDALYELTLANQEMPWLDWWIDRAGNRALVESSLQQQRETGGMWAGIWCRDQLAGVLGLTGVNPWNRTARLDYWLGAAFQGQGLVTRSATALLRYGFTELKLNRVQITCAVANHRSRAVAERLGFTRDGTLRQAERFNPRVHVEAEFAPGELSERSEDGARFFDHAVYSLLQREWLERFGGEPSR